jgi:geranylgeranyl diphosphate synthase type 3
LLEPYTYITANPGKKVTEKLVEGFNLRLNVPKDKLAVVKRAAGLFHNASLLHVSPHYRTNYNAN